MDPTNRERTDRAGRAIYALTGIYRDSESCTVDFFADLMHSWGRDGVANALRNALRHHAAESVEPDAVAVIVARADADTLADALATAAEREAAEANDGWHDDDERAIFAERVRAIDRLAAAIAAAVRQEGND